MKEKKVNRPKHVSFLLPQDLKCEMEKLENILHSNSHGNDAEKFSLQFFLYHVLQILPTMKMLMFEYSHKGCQDIFLTNPD